MDWNYGIHVEYGKDDIAQDCKYCSKTDKKGFGYNLNGYGDYAYGFECKLRSNKRNAHRCRYCYFGHF